MFLVGRKIFRVIGKKYLGQQEKIFRRIDKVSATGIRRGGRHPSYVTALNYTQNHTEITIQLVS